MVGEVGEVPMGATGLRLLLPGSVGAKEEGAVTDGMAPASGADVPTLGAVPPIAGAADCA